MSMYYKNRLRVAKRTYDMIYIALVVLLIGGEIGLGAVGLNYLLIIFFGKMVDWGWAILLGALTGFATAPIALIVYILKFLGVM